MTAARRGHEGGGDGGCVGEEGFKSLIIKFESSRFIHTKQSCKVNIIAYRSDIDWPNILDFIEKQGVAKRHQYIK